MRANRNLLGIASLIFGVMLFSTQDAIIKSISHDHAVTLAMAIRCIVALPLLLLLVHFECGLAKLRSPLFWALVMRGGILLVAYTTYYMGLPALPLAEATTWRLLFFGQTVLILAAFVAAGDAVDQDLLDSLDHRLLDVDSRIDRPAEPAQEILVVGGLQSKQEREPVLAEADQKREQHEQQVEGCQDAEHLVVEHLVDRVQGQRALVGRYWHDAMVQVDDFKNEGVVASSTWPYQVNLLLSEKQPVASVFPKEGATGWADTTMLHVDAKHPNCAYLWLEHSLNPKLQGDLSAWFGSVPSVPAACKGNKLLGDEGCARQGFNSFDKISFWRTPTSQCATQNNQCVPYHKWVSDYIAVLGGR